MSLIRRIQKIITSFVCIILIGFSFGQQRLITGRLIDEESSEPIKYAEISGFGDDRLVKTNYSGFFQLELASADSIINIYHIAYGDQNLVVPSINNFLVKLRPKAFRLPDLFFLDFVFNDSLATNYLTISNTKRGYNNAKPVEGWKNLYQSLYFLLDELRAIPSNTDAIVRFQVNSDGTIGQFELLGTINSRASTIKDLLKEYEWMPAEQVATVDQIVEIPVRAEDRIYTSVEKQSHFPGGLDAFKNYLRMNLLLPRDAYELGQIEKVVCSFVVEKDGTLNRIAVKEYYQNGLDQEAIDVLSKSGKWVPALRNGVVVRHKTECVIDFSLARNLKEKEEFNPEFYPRIHLSIPAKFKGGVEKYYELLAKEIHFPESMIKQGIEGPAYLSFNINSLGKPVDIGVFHSFEELSLNKVIDHKFGSKDELQLTVEKAVNKMPCWKPAEILGKEVGQRSDSRIGILFTQSDSTRRFGYLYDVVVAGNDTIPAKYPGGYRGLGKFLYKKRQKIWERVPLNNSDNSVIADLTISENGEITEYKITGDLPDIFSQDAARIIEKMPDWIPAFTSSYNISSKVRLYINYTYEAERDINSANETYRRALKNYKEKRYTRSIELFDAAISKAPHKVDFYYDKAITYLEMEEIGLATEVLEKIKKYDKQAEALYNSISLTKVRSIRSDN